MKIIDRSVINNGIVCFYFILFSIKTVAQKKGFSGIWLLKERISMTGPSYENGMTKLLKVNLQSDSIIIERLNMGGDGKEYTFSERMSLDGTSVTMLRPVNRKRVSAIKWSGDNKTLIDSITYYKPNSDSEIDYATTEYWNFSDSTKMLTVEKSEQSSNGDKWSMKGIYEQKTQAQLSFETAKGQGIRFEKGSNWENIKAKAKQENKYIFVDCFATWCGPCKKMDMEIYPLNRVGDFMNNKFISLKMQMDTAKNDNEEVHQWYASAHDFMQQYNIIGFPTFLFFSPDGVIVHKGMGYYKTEEFINLSADAIDPSKQYFSLLRDYKSGRKDYTNMDGLALKAKELGDKELADSIAIDYKINFLNKLTIEELCSMKYLQMITRFYPTYNNVESSKSGLFKLFYEHGKKIDDQIKYNGYSSDYINAVITREEIDANLNLIGVELDWAEIQGKIKDKYPKIDADLLILAAQVKYYGKRKDWNNQIKYFEMEVDKYGPLILGIQELNGQGSDNVIVDMTLLHCDDERILNKAIGWIELIIKSKAYMYPIAFVYGNYGGILYKAGRRKEGIDCFEKQLSAIGYKSGDDIDKDPRVRPKLEILEKMRRGKKIDSTWNIAAFY